MYHLYFWPISLVSGGFCRVCGGTGGVVLKGRGAQTALESAARLVEVPKGCSGGDFDNPAAHRAIGGGRVPTPAPPSLRKVTAPSYHGPDTLPCALLTRCAPEPGSASPGKPTKEPPCLRSAIPCRSFCVPRVFSKSVFCVLGFTDRASVVLDPPGGFYVRVIGVKRCKQCHRSVTRLCLSIYKKNKGYLSVVDIVCLPVPLPRITLHVEYCLCCVSSSL